MDALKQNGSLQRVTLGSRSEMSPVQQSLRQLNATLVHGLEVDEEIAGLVVLGNKKNGAPFTAEDLTFLNALGQITNVAVHSARVDQDLSRLNEDLQHKIERITQQQRQLAVLHAELSGRQDGGTAQSAVSPHEEFRRDAIRGNSPAIQRVLTTIRKVAGSESSVLLRGESGTGKELLARVLHDNSPRRNGALITVHCAALAPNLLESELFGHVKGAFTGAHRDRVGRFDVASGGTLFLDEIGDISLETQIKLLRVLQERCFEPVGGTRTIETDVRLITATHQNLEKLIAEGRFREDLYYRLNVISVVLPALRERKEDLFELAVHFLNRESSRLGKRISRFDDDVVDALTRYDWPGNIRELENVIERAVVLADGESITWTDLSPELLWAVQTSDPRSGSLPERDTLTAPADRRPEPVGEAGKKMSGTFVRAGKKLSGTFVRQESADGEETSERELLIRVLRECGGNKAQAARQLGLPRSTYFSKLKKYAIE